VRGQVFALGVTLNGQPVTRKQLGQLFDSIDLDHSGWLDLEEAKNSPQGLGVAGSCLDQGARDQGEKGAAHKEASLEEAAGCAA
jgi:hypothetical protein